jgi:hypothetical protein
LRRTLTRALRDVVVVGLIVAVLAAAATEAAGAVLTGSLPTLPTHVAAVAVGLSLGYAAAVTVAFRALLGGIIEAMEWVVAEVERLAGGVIREAETVLRPSERSASPSTPLVAARAGTSGSTAGLSGGMIGGIEDER